ncbi:hypothetical protein [Dolichospermum flos-aquae]|uniref:Uncharacterized protein n=1 Tax=Dolichospermum flos-aquae CCAP 1403/13F TaxID=315271 RepID=A0A6H2BYN7_DOLFA|nr:hypothetical protein [Dolichospermum flos-aquae]QJB44293.1 hypothetical protein HGD76_08965 [Dolichospermum flos-aquae CCAP 1403/13F]
MSVVSGQWSVPINSLPQLLKRVKGMGSQVSPSDDSCGVLPDRTLSI